MADLVVFGEDWGGLPSSTQHLIGHLLKRHRVIWINSIGLRSPKPGLRDFLRIIAKVRAMLGLSQKPERVKDGPQPIILNPKVIPFHGFSHARKINKRWLTEAILSACAEHDFKDIILWTSLPTAVDIVGSLGEKASIYYCGDDFNALDGVDHATVNPMERELVSKVDLTLVVSEALAHKFAGHNTIMLPHGVDFELFSKPSSCPRDVPDKKPTAGFYGSLSEWLDVEMMAQTATAMPGWNFVFVGTVKTRVGVLEELPNVHFLGPKAHSRLPGYVQNWDVALLPFRHNRQIQACNPLKLREYLASGTAIASTDFPAVRLYKDLIAIQKNKEPFSRVIQRAYESRDNKQARQDLVANESWQHRANQLEDLIIHLAQK
ncbi:hypothetical protein GZ77_13000 [Endozoicomonas montiporae]|uniref:Glycosyl transferase n=2 Tax=Endozoicomonas montiporae TaxID=1027273 RepID=A0A081N4G1_9GAMM|nr:glycosyltransferase [Endozoicomonas montiporae]AMO57814.1 glycosyltransferase [Endozoicomonas montiporae CL-33]KEQ13334.1 hypothetical protein GZ77_13000 [Endozoicomonas montiporae]